MKEVRKINTLIVLMCVWMAWITGVGTTINTAILNDDKRILFVTIPLNVVSAILAIWYTVLVL